MRSVWSVVAATALIVACDGVTAPPSFQPQVDDSLVPEALRAAYLEDANRLALRELEARGYDGITIPPDAVQPYYAALVLVHHATGLPARDTVVDIYGIHTFPYPATRNLFMIVAGDQEWAQRLVRDSVPTGNAVVDQLLSDYDLSFYRVSNMSTGELFITLRSAAALNMDALAPKFLAAPGVRGAAPDHGCCDGDDIDGSIDEARVLLDYSVGYGDCPSGCIGRRAYHFAVNADGTVEYLGASGSPPPLPGQP